MEITETLKQDDLELEAFKAQVWPAADKEHYGDNQPAFLKKELTLIAKEEGKIVGYISVSVDTGVAQIEPLMVGTDLKGKGIGSKLLKAAEDKARSLGVHKVWIETGLDWNAKEFYEKHGYIVRTIMTNHTGGRDFVLMDKII